MLKRKIALDVEESKRNGYDTLLFAHDALPEAGYEIPYVFPKADDYMPLKSYSEGQLLYVMAVAEDALGRTVEGRIKAVLKG